MKINNFQASCQNYYISFHHYHPKRTMLHFYMLYIPFQNNMSTAGETSTSPRFAFCTTIILQVPWECHKLSFRTTNCARRACGLIYFVITEGATWYDFYLLGQADCQQSRIVEKACTEIVSLFYYVPFMYVHMHVLMQWMLCFAST